jgi:FSR family fosmidomycin resistance protein-like MFS transporter
VALIVVPNTFYIIWFAIVALIGLLVLSRIALWYQSHLNLRIKKSGDRFAQSISKTIVISVVILMI